MNQFEAVVASALLACVLALAVWVFRGADYLLLSASLYTTSMLLAGFFYPQMGASIEAQRGILSSPVMAVHVSVIIIGHALIGMSFFLSLAYLAGKAGINPAAVLAHMPRHWRVMTSAIAELGPKPLEDGDDPRLASLGQTNLFVAQLGTWMVIMGTFLGSYWGDFAWGRWWGWDIKEVWALMTCLIFVAILHVRTALPPRRCGLVTAILCIVAARRSCSSTGSR